VCAQETKVKSTAYNELLYKYSVLFCLSNEIYGTGNIFSRWEFLHQWRTLWSERNAVCVCADLKLSSLCLVILCSLFSHGIICWLFCPSVSKARAATLLQGQLAVLVDTAQSLGSDKGLLATPYIWGGEEAKGFCFMLPTYCRC